MIKKVPVPINLLKTAIGFREDSEIVRLTISGDTVNFHILEDMDSSSVLTAEIPDEKLELSYRS